jgi:PAS domain-containing protein
MVPGHASICIGADHDEREVRMLDRNWSEQVASIVLELYLSSSYNYLLFHSLIEITSIAIAYTLFILTWNTRSYWTNNYIKSLGIGYAFIALIDLLHMLTYKGMGAFAGDGANPPTQLWISARYLQAVMLLAAPFFLKRRVGTRTIMGMYAMAVSVLAAFYLIYRAILVTGLQEPFGLIFRDHKQTEEALRKHQNTVEETIRARTVELCASEAMYRSLVQNVQAAIVLHDGRGRILDSNPLAQDLLGLSEEQFLGKSLVDPDWHFLREERPTEGPLFTFHCNRHRKGEALKSLKRVLLVEDDTKDIEFVDAVKQTGDFGALINQPRPNHAPEE